MYQTLLMDEYIANTNQVTNIHRNYDAYYHHYEEDTVLGILDYFKSVLLKHICIWITFWNKFYSSSWNLNKYDSIKFKILYIDDGYDNDGKTSLGNQVFDGVYFNISDGVNYLTSMNYTSL